MSNSRLPIIASGESDDYCLYAQSLRTYVTQAFLPCIVHADTIYSFRKGSDTLTVLTHPHRFPPMIKGVKLSYQDGIVGVWSMWHHGIEELFFIQSQQGQWLSRSLRSQHDVTIEQGLRALSFQLLMWHDSET
jgi:hypothetical protein